ncbi:nuclear transport factor 2 family protein [Chondromyces crocatus]|nr:nuclear transport factor 2 family protein [Chondromyces crocatus]
MRLSGLAWALACGLSACTASSTHMSGPCPPEAQPAPGASGAIENAATAKGAAASEGTADTAAIEAELEALHRRLVAAYASNDVATLEQLVAPDHIHNNVFGMLQDKEALLGDIRSGTLRFQSYDITSSRWFIEGDLAIVTGTLSAVAERAGKPVPVKAFRFTRIFRKRDGAWLEFLFHNTMIVTPPGAPPAPGAR